MCDEALRILHAPAFIAGLIAAWTQNLQAVTLMRGPRKAGTGTEDDFLKSYYCIRVLMMCVQLLSCHSEVRGQLSEIGFLSSPWGSGDRTQVFRLVLRSDHLAQPTGAPKVPKSVTGILGDGEEKLSSY